MSRSLGDAYLRPLVIATPETQMQQWEWQLPNAEQTTHGPPGRQEIPPPPSFLIIASDGLWDVMSNQEAVDTVAEVCGVCGWGQPAYPTDNDGSGSGSGSGVSPPSQSRDERTCIAAQRSALELVKRAQMKGTSDNTTVLVALLPLPLPRG